MHITHRERLHNLEVSHHFPPKFSVFGSYFFDSQLTLNINKCVTGAEPLGIPHFAYLLSIHAISQFMLNSCNFSKTKHNFLASHVALQEELSL